MKMRYGYQNMSMEMCMCGMRTLSYTHLQVLSTPETMAD